MAEAVDTTGGATGADAEGPATSSIGTAELTVEIPPYGGDGDPVASPYKSPEPSPEAEDQEDEGPTAEHVVPIPGILAVVKSRRRVTVSADLAMAEEEFTAKSYGCFSYRSSLRRVAYRMMVHPAFDPIVMLLIVLSSVMLALEDFSMVTDPTTGLRVPVTGGMNALIMRALSCSPNVVASPAVQLYTYNAL